MLTSAWISALVAVFAWWFFTGLILLLVRHADAARTNRHGFYGIVSVPFLALGVAGLATSAEAFTITNVYMSFISILLIWGWIEFVFLLGIVTGPEKSPCPSNLEGWDRFVRAWHALSHHELMLLCGLLITTVVTTGTENATGFWIYLVLFAARISAKLNLFFGVPRINTEFVPKRLDHLKSYFRQGRITAAFAVGVTFMMLTTACFATQLSAAQTAPAIVAAALLTTLAALAALEHWLMVIPLPDAKLWRWMLPAPPNATKTGQSHEL